MSDRSREVFRRVVEGYLASGDPVGSRTLTRIMNRARQDSITTEIMEIVGGVEGTFAALADAAATARESAARGGRRRRTGDSG